MPKKRLSKSKCEPCRELRIHNIGANLSGDIHNISRHVGVTKSAYIRKELSLVAAAFPDDIKSQSPEVMPVKEIHIFGISETLVKQLSHIAINMGVKPSEYIAVKIAEIAYREPAHMKTPMIG